MQPVDQLALHVGLVVLQNNTMFLGIGTQVGHDVVQRLTAVDLRLAETDKIEVRSVEEENCFST